MKWETMQAVIWLYIVAYAIFLLTVILVVDGGPVKTGTVVGLCVVYLIGGLALMYMKNRLREKQNNQGSVKLSRDK